MPRSPDPIDKHVGQRIRMQRKLRNISQQSLGDALSITFQQVQKYEKGVNRIGSSRLTRIAAHLGVPVAFFFEGIAPGESAASTAPTEEGELIARFCATPGATALMKSFIAIADQPDRHLVVRMADRMSRIVIAEAAAPVREVSGSEYASASSAGPTTTASSSAPAQPVERTPPIRRVSARENLRRQRPATR